MMMGLKGSGYHLTPHDLIHSAHEDVSGPLLRR